MYKVCRVVVLVFLSHTAEHLKFLLIGGVWFGDDVENILIGGLLKHAVGTHIKIVARLNVGEVGNVGSCTLLLTGLHGTRDNILLRVVERLLLCNLAYFDKVVDERMVARVKDDARWRMLGGRTQLVNAAVANVSHRCAIGVQTKESHCSAHFAFGPIVLGIERVVGSGKGLTKEVVAEGFIGMPLAEYRTTNLLAHRGRSHLAFFMSTHSVAQYEKAAICCRLS